MGLRPGGGASHSGRAACGARPAGRSRGEAHGTVVLGCEVVAAAGRWPSALAGPGRFCSCFCQRVMGGGRPPLLRWCKRLPCTPGLRRAPGGRAGQAAPLGANPGPGARRNTLLSPGSARLSRRPSCPHPFGLSVPEPHAGHGQARQEAGSPGSTLAAVGSPPAGRQPGRAGSARWQPRVRPGLEARLPVHSGGPRGSASVAAPAPLGPGRWSRPQAGSPSARAPDRTWGWGGAETLSPARRPPPCPPSTRFGVHLSTQRPWEAQLPGPKS